MSFSALAAKRPAGSLAALRSYSSPTAASGVKQSLVSIQTDKAYSLPSNNQCGSPNGTSWEVMTILPIGDFPIYVLFRFARLSINDEQGIDLPALTGPDVELV